MFFNTETGKTTVFIQIFFLFVEFSKLGHKIAYLFVGLESLLLFQIYIYIFLL